MDETPPANERRSCSRWPPMVAPWLSTIEGVLQPAGQPQLLKGKKILVVGIRTRLARLGRGVNGLQPELEVLSVASLAIGISAWRGFSSSHFMEVVQSEWPWD